MESNVSMMEGSEWGSFHGVVSFNEEADFMAQLMFPNCALDNNDLESLSSSCYSGLTVGGGCGSFFSNNHEYDDDNDYKNNNNNNNNNNNSNMCSLAQEMISNTSYSDNCNNNNNNTAKCPVRLSDVMSVAYPFYYENGFLGAKDDNNGCSFPVELCPSVAKNFIQLFPGNPMERNDSLSGLDEQHSDEQHCSNNQKHQEDEMCVSLKKDKSTENLGCGRKRSRISENNKGKRNTRTKKNNNERNNNNDNNGCDNNEENNSSSSEEESHEMSGGVASSSLSSKGTTIVNTNGKTRASRGAATDPQSLYARKRRERINERLRILQNLVPNGAKVDISTMLEEAVHYVKFLQQQIKLLSSDDLWMYAPLAYNGMDIGLDSKLRALL